MTPIPERSVIGVDIGAAGGIVYNHEGRVYSWSRPSLHTIAGAVKNLNPIMVCAENVHAFQGQGAVSTGKLLQARGQLEGVCAALNAKLDFIEPEKWIDCYTMQRGKHFLTDSGNKSTTKWKRHLLEIAATRANKYGLLVNEIEVADAYLIWEYALNIVNGTPLKSKGTFVL